jgi:hypothetical protein
MRRRSRAHTRLKSLRNLAFVAMTVGGVSLGIVIEGADEECWTCTDRFGDCEPAGEGEWGVEHCNDSGPECTLWGRYCEGDAEGG